MRSEATSPAPSLTQTVGPVGPPAGAWQLNSTVSPLPKTSCSCWPGSGSRTSVGEMGDREAGAPKPRTLGAQQPWEAPYFADTLMELQCLGSGARRSGQGPG